MPIKWKDNSLEKVIQKLTLTEEMIEEFKNDALQKLGERLHELIVDSSPKKSGEFAKGWKVDPIQDNKITVSNPDNKKFTILEFTGKRQTRIEAKPGKVLHFVINGEDIFVKHASPKGFEPQPFVRPSLETLEREGKDIVVDVFKRKFDVFG